MYARIRAILTALSALLLMLTLTLWLRSYRRADIGGLFVAGGRLQAAGSYWGKMHFFLSDLEFGHTRAWSLDVTSGTLDEFLSLRDALTSTPALDRGTLGLRLVRSPPQSFYGATYWIVVLPHWLLALLFAFLPIAWLRHHLRVRRRIKHHLCLHCGYDLRSSTDRCPECGHPTPTTSAPVTRATSP